MAEETKIFVHCNTLDEIGYPASCPFNTSRAGKVRKLLANMGLLNGPDRKEAEPRKASRDEMEQFHQADYLDIMQRADSGEFGIEMLEMGLGTGDCPVFKGMYKYAELGCGATITAAEHILNGKAIAAFNPSGGYHHAHARRAAGFCYINDVVLGCNRLVKGGKRVLNLDIDVHHGDGVQEAFYDRNDVMTISMHQTGRTLFPGTGFEDEIGTGAGKGYCVNLPMPVGTYDEIYMRAFEEVVKPLVSAFEPDVISMEIGADGLSGDPLANLMLTNNVYADIVGEILRFGKPVLAVGGGGYNIENTVRAWALVWTALCGDDQHDAHAGMGGVLMESVDWHGGFRDRMQICDSGQREIIEPVVEATIEKVKKNVFGYHGL